MLDVLCMGSATVDLFVTIDHPFSLCTSGEKILMHDLDYETGGGGSNASVSFAKLGVRTGYLGKFGSDDFATRILLDLKKVRVHVVKTKRSTTPSAFSIVMESSKEKDRIIYVHKGATNELSLRDFRFPKAKWLYLSSTMGETLETVKQLLPRHLLGGGKVLFNPSSYLTRTPGLIKDILAHTDILVMNKEEAQLLCEKKLSIKKLGEQLLSFKVKQVIITDGKKGVYFFDGIRKLHIPSLDVPTVSTAGAGDAFTSGYLAGTILGESIEMSLKIGVANACSVIGKRGAKKGLLSFKEAKAQTEKLSTLFLT